MVVVCATPDYRGASQVLRSTHKPVRARKQTEQACRQIASPKSVERSLKMTKWYVLVAVLATLVALSLSAPLAKREADLEENEETEVRYLNQTFPITLY